MLLGAEGRDLGIMKSCDILYTSERFRKKFMKVMIVFPLF